jgi:SNF2 family DNA or RNA helicase
MPPHERDEVFIKQLEREIAELDNVLEFDDLVANPVANHVNDELVVTERNIKFQPVSTCQLLNTKEEQYVLSETRMLHPLEANFYIKDSNNVTHPISDYPGNIVPIGPKIREKLRDLKITLKPHQCRIVWEMLKKYQSPYITNMRVNIDYSIMCDSVGSGKTFSALAFAIMYQNQEVYPDKRLINSKIYIRNSGCFDPIGFTYDEDNIIDTVLIIVPHTLYAQWETVIKTQTKLKMLGLKGKINFTNLTRESMEAVDVVLIKSTITKYLTLKLDEIMGKNTKEVSMKNCQFSHSKTLVKEYWKITEEIAKLDIEYLHAKNEDNMIQMFDRQEKKLELELKRNQMKFAKYILKKGITDDIFEHSEIKHKQIHYNYAFSLIMMDEAHQQVLNKFPGQHTCFITSSLNDLNHKIYNNFSYYKDDFMCLNVFKNFDYFIKESFDIPAYVPHIHECFSPFELKIVQEFGKDLPDVMAAISAGDFAVARELLGGKTAKSGNICQLLTDKLLNEQNELNKNLSKKKQSLEHNIVQLNLLQMESDEDSKIEKIRIRSSISYCNKMIEEYEKTVGRLDTRIDALREKTKNILEKECGICLGTVNNPVMVPCCKETYCLECLMSSLNIAAKSCPHCRTRFPFEDLIPIVQGNDEESDEDEDEESTRLPTKMEKMVKIVSTFKKDKSKRFLIFADFNNPLKDINEHLSDIGIIAQMVKGTGDTIAQIIENFQKGRMPVLLLNATHLAAGLNLQMTSDIIIMHRLSTHNQEMQVIGRGQRPGRTSTLQVHYLCNKKELEEGNMH